MAKALKPLIIVLLVLSIASLILGSMLFTKREVLRGRADRTAEGVAKIAASLQDTTFSASSLAAEKAEDLGKIDNSLAQLSTVAANKVEELANTKNDLETTRADLNATKDELSTTKTSLATARDEVARLNEDLSSAKAATARAQDEAAAAEQAKAAVEAQVQELNDKIATVEDEKRDMQDKVTTLEQTIAQLEGELNPGGVTMEKGLSGKVVIVNDAWNFVILDIGSKNGVVPQGELLVHRNDKLIGKLVVSDVKDNLAVAEIVAGWQQGKIQEGDYVVH